MHAATTLSLFVRTRANRVVKTKSLHESAAVHMRRNRQVVERDLVDRRVVVHSAVDEMVMIYHHHFSMKLVSTKLVSIEISDISLSRLGRAPMTLELSHSEILIQTPRLGGISLQ